MIFSVLEAFSRVDCPGGDHLATAAVADDLATISEAMTDRISTRQFAGVVEQRRTAEEQNDSPSGPGV